VGELLTSELGEIYLAKHRHIATKDKNSTDSRQKSSFLFDSILSELYLLLSYNIIEVENG
jgi:hypothetical protein